MINIRARGEREDSSDLTSLIDVVFILLIFFILAASFAVHSIDFDLPPAKTSKALAGHVVEIRLNKDGSFLCDGIPTKKEELDEGRKMSELSNDTLKIGISLAILCHCFGLMFLTAPAPSEEDFPMTVIVKLDSAQAAVSEQGQSLGMESVSENSLTEKKVADKKREIYLQYLEDVSLCIHARRFLEPNSHGLIGIAKSVSMPTEFSQQPIFTKVQEISN